MIKKSKFLVVLFIFSSNTVAEIYSCPFIVDDEAMLLRIERIEDENKFKDLMYPKQKPWEIFFEDKSYLVLTDYGTNSNFYMEVFVLDKKSLTYQWSVTESTIEVIDDPVLKGKCIVE